MPAPRKVDLLPDALRQRLREALAARGFGDIVEVTGELNAWLENEGLELRIGKSAIGEYALLLKDQRKAFAMADTVLSELDIEAETDIHRALVQMITTSAMHMMAATREEDAHLDAKSLMDLSRMLQSLMSSAGMREKLLAGERARVAAEAREAERAAAMAALSAGEETGDLTREAAEAARRVMGFT